MSQLAKSRWLPRFSVRSLLVLFVLISLAIVAPRYRSISQRYAAKKLIAKGIELEFHDLRKPQETWRWLIYGSNHFDGVRKISIKGVAITDSDVTQMLRFPLIYVVELDRCPTSQVLLRRVAEFKYLQALNIESSPITNEDVATLAKVDLQSIRIDNPSQPDFDLSPFALESSQFSGPQYMYVSGSGISDRTLQGIGRIQSLLHLSIHNASVTDSGLRPLGQLNGLQRLAITHCDITGSTLDCFKECPQLSDLDLSGSHIDSAGVAQIISLSQVHSINLQSTKVTKQDTLKLRGLVLSDFMFDSTP